jgi:hypothetical protein
MMPALPAKQLDRLVKVAGLLASDQPGEVFNAAQAATRILREARLTWADLITGSISTAAAPRKASRQPQSASGDWRNDITACRARPDLLTDWERCFLENLTSFASLFPKQRATLSRLRECVRMAGAAP